MEKNDFIKALDQLKMVLFLNDASTDLVVFVNKCKDLYVSGSLTASEVRSNLAAHIGLGFYYVSRNAREMLLEDKYLQFDDCLDVMHIMRYLL